MALSNVRVRITHLRLVEPARVGSDSPRCHKSGLSCSSISYAASSPPSLPRAATSASMPARRAAAAGGNSARCRPQPEPQEPRQGLRRRLASLSRIHPAAATAAPAAASAAAPPVPAATRAAGRRRCSRERRRLVGAAAAAARARAAPPPSPGGSDRPAVDDLLSHLPHRRPRARLPRARRRRRRHRGALWRAHAASKEQGLFPQIRTPTTHQNASFLSL